MDNLKHILDEVGLMVQPSGELQKFTNTLHNVGMTPMLALTRYLAKKYEQEVIVSRNVEIPLPKVINCYKATPWEVASAVFCGRGGPWGNPFVIGKDGTRDEVCDKFEQRVLPNLDVSLLRGRNLLCFCVPYRCHCDSLLEKANK